MKADRLPYMQEIERLRGSKAILYVTGTRHNLETQIETDILPIFADHLDEIGDVGRISLILYSNGGSTLAGWSIVNLIRSFCKDFEVIIPFRCQSAATLLSLGANRIIMTKQATLGPIDPSTNGFMNPQVNIDGQQVRVPVSVEHVNGYIDMAKADLSINDQQALKDVYLKLADHIHPLSLGNVYKSKAQIQMLAEKLLKYHEIDPENIPKVVSFLCSESGSHDYTIYRKEAKESLGLNIEKPDEELYTVIKSIYQDFESELDLRSPYNPVVSLGGQQAYQYEHRRAIVESISGGGDTYISRGTLSAQLIPGTNQIALQDSRIFEGWSHENA